MSFVHKKVGKGTKSMKTRICPIIVQYNDDLGFPAVARVDIVEFHFLTTCGT